MSLPSHALRRNATVAALTHFNICFRHCDFWRFTFWRFHVYSCAKFWILCIHGRWIWKSCTAPHLDCEWLLLLHRWRERRRRYKRRRRRRLWKVQTFWKCFYNFCINSCRHKLLRPGKWMNFEWQLAMQTSLWRTYIFIRGCVCICELVLLSSQWI